MSLFPEAFTCFIDFLQNMNGVTLSDDVHCLVYWNPNSWIKVLKQTFSHICCFFLQKMGRFVNQTLLHLFNIFSHTRSKYLVIFYISSLMLSWRSPLIASPLAELIREEISSFLACPQSLGRSLSAEFALFGWFFDQIVTSSLKFLQFFGSMLGTFYSLFWKINGWEKLRGMKRLR